MPVCAYVLGVAEGRHEAPKNLEGPSITAVQRMGVMGGWQRAGEEEDR